MAPVGCASCAAATNAPLTRPGSLLLGARCIPDRLPQHLARSIHCALFFFFHLQFSRTRHSSLATNFAFHRSRSVAFPLATFLDFFFYLPVSTRSLVPFPGSPGSPSAQRPRSRFSQLLSQTTTLSDQRRQRPKKEDSKNTKNTRRASQIA